MGDPIRSLLLFIRSTRFLLPAVPAAAGVVFSLPTDVEGQGVLDRTPNLSGGWVGTPGPLHFHVVHRFWMVGSGDDDKVINSPTMLVALPLRGAFLVGARYATNSLSVGGRANEWEGFARWAPVRDDDHPVGLAVSAARNTAAESFDGELTLSLRVPRPGAPSVSRGGGPVAADLGPGVRFIAAARGFTDALGEGEPGFALAGGASVRLSDGMALSGDVGTLIVDGTRSRPMWGVGIQLRVPASPHTLSIQAANTRTTSLQGASAHFRTMWGFEFTVPLTPARYVPRLRRAPLMPSATDSVAAEVLMTDDLLFLPDTVRIRVGETVEWRNPGIMPHTVTADPEYVRDPSMISLPEGADPFDSGILLTGDVFRHTFDVPGTYVYLCVPHDVLGMTGVVIVTP